MDYLPLLKALCLKGSPTVLAGFAAALPQCIAVANLTTSKRLAAFIAQCAHESDGFRTTVEYASGAAYEGRKDLGNTVKGDGVRFKGRGVIQLTGRANYAAYGKLLGVDLVGNPSLAAAFPYAALTAAHFWNTKKLNAFADAGDLKEVTRRINGGYNGLAQRLDYYSKALKVVQEPKAEPDVKQPEKSVEAPKTSSAIVLTTTIAGGSAAAAAQTQGLPLPIVIGLVVVAFGFAAFLIFKARKATQ